MATSRGQYARPGVSTNGAAESLIEQARRLRWRAPEIALVLGERVAAVTRDGAGSVSASATRVRAESLVVFGMVRLGRRASAVNRGLTALRAAEHGGVREAGWQLRTDLAVCARSAGAPLAGVAALRPVLESDEVDGALRAQALTQLVGCLARLGGSEALDRAMAEAGRLCTSQRSPDEDTQLMLRALVQASLSAYRRRCSDSTGARQAARAGLEVLSNMRDPLADGGQATSRLTLELVCALLDAGEFDEAMKVAGPVLSAPPRTPVVAARGWLLLAIATRVHLAASRNELALSMLREAVYYAERHGLDGLTTRLWTELAHVEQLVGSDSAAVECLYQARAAGYRHERARRMAAGSLVEWFGTVDPRQLRVEELIGRGQAVTRYGVARYDDTERGDGTARDYGGGRDYSAGGGYGSASEYGSDYRMDDRESEAAELDRSIAELTRRVTGQHEDSGSRSEDDSHRDAEPSGRTRNDPEATPRRRAQWSPSVVRGMGGSGTSNSRRRGRRRAEDREPGHRSFGDEIQLSAVSATERWRRSRNLRDETQASDQAGFGSDESTSQPGPGSSDGGYSFGDTDLAEPWSSTSAFDDSSTGQPAVGGGADLEQEGNRRARRAADADSDAGRGILSQLSFTSGSGGRRRAPTDADNSTTPDPGRTPGAGSIPDAASIPNAGSVYSDSSTRETWESQQNPSSSDDSRRSFGARRADLASSLEEILARIERTSAQHRADSTPEPSHVDEQFDPGYPSNGQAPRSAESSSDWSQLDTAATTDEDGSVGHDELMLPILRVPSVLAAPGETLGWATGPDAEPPEFGDAPGNSPDYLSDEQADWSVAGWPTEQDDTGQQRFVSAGIAQDEAWPAPSQAPGESAEPGQPASTGTGANWPGRFDRFHTTGSDPGERTWPEAGERTGGRHASSGEWSNNALGPSKRRGATDAGRVQGRGGSSEASERTGRRSAPDNGVRRARRATTHDAAEAGHDAEAGHAPATGQDAGAGHHAGARHHAGVGQDAGAGVGPGGASVNGYEPIHGGWPAPTETTGRDVGLEHGRAGDPGTQAVSNDAAGLGHRANHGDTADHGRDSGPTPVTGLPDRTGGQGSETGETTGSGVAERPGMEQHSADDYGEDRADLGLADLLAGALAAYRTTEDNASRYRDESRGQHGADGRRRGRGRHRSVD